MNEPYRPYDDGNHSRSWRRAMRQDAWKDIGKRKPIKGTERLCSECHKWFKTDDAGTWCEHLKRVEVDPVKVGFTPYYHPEIQPGGAWIASRSEEKKALKICQKDFMY